MQGFYMEVTIMAIYKDAKGNIHGGRMKNITGMTNSVRKTGTPMVKTPERINELRTAFKRGNKK